MPKESSSKKKDNNDDSDQMKELKDELDSWKRKYFALEAKMSKYNMDSENVNLFQIAIIFHKQESLEQRLLTL
jgi:molecular chaperone GrpE (heat shock protein)